MMKGHPLWELQLVWVMLFTSHGGEGYTAVARSTWRWMGVPLPGEPLVFGNPLGYNSVTQLMLEDRELQWILVWGARRKLPIRKHQHHLLVDTTCQILNLDVGDVWRFWRCALSERSLNHPGRFPSNLWRINENGKSRICSSWCSCMPCWDILRTFAERLMWGKWDISIIMRHTIPTILSQ